VSFQTVRLIVWLGVIFFSSTDVAGRWADALYAALFGAGGGGDAGWGYLAAQKGFHVGLFGLFGLFGFWWARHSRLAKLNVWAAPAACLAAGLASEGVQMLFATRSPQWGDVALNAASGGVVALWVRARRNPSTG